MSGAVETAGRSRCANCAAELAGRWCAACGQKTLEDDDRRFGHLLRQFSHELFHVDGKLPRTLGALLFRPGRLSEAYLAGRRARYISPIGLFLIINVVYFLAPPLTDFNLSLDEQIHLQPYSPLIRPLVEERLASRGVELADYAAAYDVLAAQLARSLIIVHLPLLALVLLALFPRHRLYYAEHFIVACHLFGFMLAVVTVAGTALRFGFTLASRVSGAGLPAALGVVWYIVPLALLAYWLVAMRRVYRIGWARAVASMIGWSAGFLLLHLLVYRPGKFLVAFALT